MAHGSVAHALLVSAAMELTVKMSMRYVGCAKVTCTLSAVYTEQYREQYTDQFQLQRLTVPFVPL